MQAWRQSFINHYSKGEHKFCTSVRLEAERTRKLLNNHGILWPLPIKRLPLSCLVSSFIVLSFIRRDLAKRQLQTRVFTFQIRGGGPMQGLNLFQDDSVGQGTFAFMSAVLLRAASVPLQRHHCKTRLPSPVIMTLHNFYRRHSIKGFKEIWVPFWFSVEEKDRSDKQTMSQKGKTVPDHCHLRLVFLLVT